MRTGIFAHCKCSVNGKTQQIHGEIQILPNTATQSALCVSNYRVRVAYDLQFSHICIKICEICIAKKGPCDFTVCVDGEILHKIHGVTGVRCYRFHVLLVFEVIFYLIFNQHGCELNS